MRSRKQLCLLAVLALSLVLATAASAQLVDYRPDVAIQGSGVVLFGNNTGNFAEFNVNVLKYGANLTGGFRWVEYTKPGVRPTTVLCKQVVGLKFLADNHVVIEAKGVLNDRPAKITFTVLDDGMMDAVKVRAETLPTTATMPTVIYEKGGGVAKGGVTIFRKPECCTTFGNGMIKVNDNIGRFSFKAMSAPNGLFGHLIYQEINPLATGPTVRPVVTIEMQRLLAIKQDGQRAIFEGLGIMNGLPAKIRVTVEDNVRPGPVVTDVADFFSIEATPTVPTFAPADYAAKGPLVRGDIVVQKIVTVQPE